MTEKKCLEQRTDEEFIKEMGKSFYIFNNIKKVTPEMRGTFYYQTIKLKIAFQELAEEIKKTFTIKI